MVGGGGDGFSGGGPESTNQRSDHFGFAFTNGSVAMLCVRICFQGDGVLGVMGG